ncbi:membrane-associated protein, putative [Bodo saltans]|uniref:carnosine N-methyltransferase n=1 Tax=Bodo saltans TaxID=75058 RepID=A0A0S4J6E7_BODSA|nr:membrane-associated protein, putative [Bodo saltans]|eukprot:CUG84679.1 membrane-associated protein, putative [Bodo saltans]
MYFATVLLLLACAIHCVYSAVTPVALLEAEWQRYVTRVQRELTPLQTLLREFSATKEASPCDENDHCEDHQSTLSPTTPNAFEEHLQHRVNSIEAAIQLNGQFISTFADVMLLHRRLQQDIDDDVLDEDTELLKGSPYWVRLEDTPPLHWRSCQGDGEDGEGLVGGGGYTSVDELFAHLHRDYGRAADDGESRHRAAVVEAVRHIYSLHGQREEGGVGHHQHAMWRRGSILVLGSGTGGLVADLRAYLLGGVLPNDEITITATECSLLFAAAAAAILSLPVVDPLATSFVTLVPWVSNFGGAIEGDTTDHLYRTTLYSPARLPHNDHLGGGGQGSAAVRVQVVVADALSPRGNVAAAGAAAAQQAAVVVTYYFIDAATSSSSYRYPRGILSVLDRIAQLCVPGGYWVHVGPLHYHRADTYPKLSVKDIELYMTHVHNFRRIDDVVVLPQEDYSRPNTTSLFVNAHRAVRLVMQRH